MGYLGGMQSPAKGDSSPLVDNTSVYTRKDQGWRRRKDRKAEEEVGRRERLGAEGERRREKKKEEKEEEK